MCALSIKSDAVDERPGKEMERHIPNYLIDFYAIVWKYFKYQTTINTIGEVQRETFFLTLLYRLGENIFRRQTLWNLLCEQIVDYQLDVNKN